MLSPFALYYPTSQQLEVFSTDDDGAVKVTWKVQNENWNPPHPLTEPGFRQAGTPLAGSYYPPGDTLEVFVASNDGRIHGLWKAPHVQHRWQPHFPLPGVAFTRPGAALAAVHYAVAYSKAAAVTRTNAGVVVLDRVRGPIVARVATAPTGPWSREIVVFDPCREWAFGNFMHWPGLDELNKNGFPY